MTDSDIGRSLLTTLKAASRREGPALVLPVGTPPAALMRPLPASAGELDRRDVRLVAAWRNRHRHRFLTEFETTEESTERWLVEQIGRRDDRILLMIDDPHGRPFGHMGVTSIDWNARRAELDAVLRGGEAPRGAMRQCLFALLRWAQAQLQLHSFFLRVRDDNPALAFYEGAGFVESRRVPMRRVAERASVRWVEDPALESPEMSVIYMEWIERRFCTCPESDRTLAR